MDEELVLHKEWVLENRFGAEKYVIEQVAQTVYSIDHMSRRVEDMLTVISEACLNAMEHGNRMNPNTRVRVAMNIRETEVRFRIYDEGDGFTYAPISDKPLQIEEECTRGWGLFLITSLSDKVHTGFDNEWFYVEVHFMRIGGMNGARE